jgi:UDP-N-acetylglucosamine 2-epimerase (non-hydrolysing)
MKILNVVGARPNFMKIAPLMREMRRHPEIVPMLVHTGQHYDVAMAGQFFRDLEITPPDVSLDVGSGSHAFQTAEVMKRIEPVMEKERPDLVIVVGDVNSTLAAAVTAAKLRIPVAHVEAGLRSFDRTMPEEINRIVTDAVSTLLFVSEESGVQNLLAEGVDRKRVFFVGNVMIDSLEASRRMWAQSTICEKLGVSKGRYGVMTLHRPSNVDDPATLQRLLRAIAEVSQTFPVIFPVHPRTRKQLEAHDELRILVSFDHATAGPRGIHCTEPFGYIDFMRLVSGARVVLTDSGGIQEETTAMGVPCLTLRENTERPVTISHGTNRLVGVNPDKILQAAREALDSPVAPPPPPPLWDGMAAQRIVNILLQRPELAGSTTCL